MHKGHRTQIKVLLLELLTLDLHTHFAIYTWHNRLCLRNFYSFLDSNFKLQQSKNIGRACA